MPQQLNQNQFRYGEKIYTLIAKIYSLKTYSSEIDNRLNGVALGTNNIESFEYVNSVNDLFLTGEMVYTDQLGDIDRFIDQQNIVIDIIFAENDQQFDGAFKDDDMSKKNRFAHAFVVNNIQILERNGRIIKYKFSLIDANIYKLIRNISFSNYDKNPEEIFDIIKSCIVRSELAVDKQTFDEVKSGVKLNYITNGNDNVLTIVPFLLNRLYYSTDKDTSVKMICLNHTNNRYFLLDIANPNTFIGKTDIPLSFFINGAETIGKVKPANFSTVTKMSGIETLQSEFANVMVGYDLNENKFTSMSYTSQNILNYANACPDGLPYRKKFTDDIKDTQYFKRSSFFNNDIDVYHNIVNTLCNNNALIINTDGDILRQPGYFVVNNVDRKNMNIQTNDVDKNLELENRYKMFDGVWNILKVRNIIKPAAQEYTQNLIVSRNFINKSNIATN